MTARCRALTLITVALISVAAWADDGNEDNATVTGSLQQRVDYGWGWQTQMQTQRPRPWAGSFAATTAASSVLVMGVSVRTGERSRLAWQTPLATTASTSGTTSRPGEMQLAWTLRSRDPVAALRGGSPFRYALSGQTVVTLKPRTSRLSVTLQHQW